MLKLINLYVIDKIFNEVSEIRLSALSQALYVNCLLHHFRNKEASRANVFSFEIQIKDFKNYDKFKKNILELEEATLISINNGAIAFNNTWGAYLDWDSIDKQGVKGTNSGFKLKDASQFKEELLSSQRLFELSMMKHKLSKNETIKIIELFIKEQCAIEKKYVDFTECAKHCIYWIASNSQMSPKEVVKSNAKILGQK